jgi:hypothetical protein
MASARQAFQTLFDFRIKLDCNWVGGRDAHHLLRQVLVGNTLPYPSLMALGLLEGVAGCNGLESTFFPPLPGPLPHGEREICAYRRLASAAFLQHPAIGTGRRNS